MSEQSATVTERLALLKQKPYAELAALPSCQGEKINRNGKAFTVAIWKEVLNESELKIVVQEYRHLFLGIGRMQADGFRIIKDGSISDLSKDEIYEFS